MEFLKLKTKKNKYKNGKHFSCNFLEKNQLLEN